MGLGLGLGLGLGIGLGLGFGNLVVEARPGEELVREPPNLR